MVGAALVLQAVELLGWGGLYWKVKADTTKQILIHGHLQPRKLPIVDKQLGRLAGHPNKLERSIADRVVKMSRSATNTVAFQHLITGLLNPRSGLRKYLKKPALIRI